MTLETRTGVAEVIAAGRPALRMVAGDRSGGLRKAFDAAATRWRLVVTEAMIAAGGVAPARGAGGGGETDE
jgi:hypothetical protein